MCLCVCACVCACVYVYVCVCVCVCIGVSVCFGTQLLIYFDPRSNIILYYSSLSSNISPLLGYIKGIFIIFNCRMWRDKHHWQLVSINILIPRGLGCLQMGFTLNFPFYIIQFPYKPHPLLMVLCTLNFLHQCYQNLTYDT